jgi:hypothetical protein
MVVRRKPGGQPGNRNAWKTGAHRKEYRKARKEIAAWLRMTNALIAEATKDLRDNHLPLVGRPTKF